ncbi:dynamin family protein [Bacillus sp. PS06]|uniref:dynamin family protein n=1 Tax=Bacillus sp. PS06 TaxID=2764176 RepID=UPI00177CD1DC|nr:dynamin family protein [Bacillus sp. PS06]MBD8071172.1 dynamin family protein [Bacillus sp. PS06]
MVLTNEQQLAQKIFYQAMDLGVETSQQVLALSKQLNQRTHSSDEIRFAQAELYFNLEDFETAVFKWEQIEKSSPLSGWATKNIGDAYVLMGRAREAEMIYQSLNTPSDALKMEGLLAQYALYLAQHQEEKLGSIVDSLVATDWSYQHVFELALAFYEEKEEYLSAFTLVVNKLEREFDESLFSKIFSYLHLSEGTELSPVFTVPKLLKILWCEDQEKLNACFVALHNYYLASDLFIHWLDSLFVSIQESDQAFAVFLLDTHSHSFYQMMNQLVSARFTVKEIEHVVEMHLPAYQALCEDLPLKQAITSCLLAWKEKFPHSSVAIKDFTFSHQKIYDWGAVNATYHSIIEWMDERGVNHDSYSKWWLDYFLEDSTKKVMITGTFSNGKSSFINSVLGEELLITDLLPTTAVVTLLQYGETKQMVEIGKQTIAVVNPTELEHRTTIDHEKDGKHSAAIFSIHTNATPLLEHQVTFIDTPGFNDLEHAQNPTYHHLDLADEVLFIFSAETPFKKTEKEILLKMIELRPELPVRFILNKADFLDEDELEDVIEDVSRKLSKQLGLEPEVIPYSSVHPGADEASDLQRYLNERNDSHIGQTRIEHAIPYFQQLLRKFDEFVHEKEMHLNVLFQRHRKEVEELNVLKQKVQQVKNELTSQCLQQYVKLISGIYHEVKESTSAELKQFAGKITTNTDLDRVHLILNQEMNQTLEWKQLNQILPQVNQKFNFWLFMIRRHFEPAKNTLGVYQLELEDILNSDESVQVTYQYEHTLEDMKQQFEQLVATITYQQIDILNRINPFQTFLKGVGKLLGGASPSMTLKVDQYRNYLENKSYDDAISKYIYNITKTLGQFEAVIREQVHSTFGAFETALETEVKSSTEKMMNQAKQLRQLHADKAANSEIIDMHLLHIRAMEIDYHQLELSEVELGKMGGEMGTVL